MSYATFLLVFLVLPIGLLVWRRSGEGTRGWALLGGLALVALVYTTPWDNYLVANRIWWYAPERVSGFRIGWVPIEEYGFFLLQPLLTGLWTLQVLGRYPGPWAAPEAGQRWRLRALVASGLVWLASVGALLAGWPASRYLALILVWVLPPLGLQFAYGADLLWADRRRVGLALLPPTLYLGAADAIAIAGGTWTINPRAVLPLPAPGGMPLEELLFFLGTNALIVFTVVLVTARYPRWARPGRLPPAHGSRA